ncbi:MAG TPA: aspartate ammonia-lyase [bacterium]|nr:aspartate ammonia-lyase [bacterium]
MGYRVEHDSIGELKVPGEALWGVQAERAVQNFPISGIKPHKVFIQATVHIKKAAARFHAKVGMLDKKKADAIVKAADEILEKDKWLDHFVVDVYQAGAGTSHNMNTNEVLANRAIEILGGKRGDYKLVHPNDMVNMGQSTNDVIPTAIRLSGLLLTRDFLPVLKKLAATFRKKGQEFKKVYKSGRTHLQDAALMTLGQEFNAYGENLERHYARIERATGDLTELGIGGSAVGTGLNTHKDYCKGMASLLSEQTGLKLTPHPNLFEAMQSMSPFVSLSNAFRNLAIDLTRIANDFRLMTSGPATGFGEILLPVMQPGSSIMPGKVNPVMAECLNMVSYQILGHDHTVAMAAQAGQMELNVMMPVLAYNLNQEITLLTNMLKAFEEKCVSGVKADEHRCRQYADQSTQVATALNPVIGYEKAAEVVKAALKEGKTVRQVVLEKKLLTEEKYNQAVQLEKIVDPHGRESKRK